MLTKLHQGIVVPWYPSAGGAYAGGGAAYHPLVGGVYGGGGSFTTFLIKIKRFFFFSI